MLAVNNLSVYYGDIQVLFEASLQVQKGEVVALLGANASGKTTLIKCISGLLKPKEGQISFEGRVINGIPAHQRVELGIIQVCEGRNLFPLMTVEENLLMGAYSKRARGGLKANLKNVYELLPVLYEKKSQMAGSLSGGQQQMVAIGRGLMGKPALLILDEPSLGLAPLIVQTVFETILEIKKQGVTVMLVEQNVVKALEQSDRGYVLENGRVILEGRGDILLNNDEVRRAYMGI